MEVGARVDIGDPQPTSPSSTPSPTRLPNRARAGANAITPDIFSLMHYQRTGDRYIVRFESGEPVVEPLLEWLAANKIGYASLTGLGAVREAKVSYWNAETRQYETHALDEQMEIVSFVGNATLKEGAPFLHIHVTLGRRDLSIIGGHFNDGVVHPNLELIVAQGKEAVARGLDEACGLWVMQLHERS